MIAWLVDVVGSLLRCIGREGSTWSWFGCVWPAGPLL